jgi:hypothetical protein
MRAACESCRRRALISLLATLRALVYSKQWLKNVQLTQSILRSFYGPS